MWRKSFQNHHAIFIFVNWSEKNTLSLSILSFFEIRNNNSIEFSGAYFWSSIFFYLAGDCAENVLRWKYFNWFFENLRGEPLHGKFQPWFKSTLSVSENVCNIRPNYALNQKLNNSVCRVTSPETGWDCLWMQFAIDAF